MIQGLFGFKLVAKNSQNQIILPAEFREIFEMHDQSGKFFVYMEENRSLLLSTLNELMRDLQSASPAAMAGMDRNAFTVFSKNVVIVNMGGDGRITLTKEMMAKAGIGRADQKVVCCGANNKIEIWSQQRYKEQIGDHEIEYTSQKRMFEQDVFRMKLTGIAAEDRGSDSLKI